MTIKQLFQKAFVGGHWGVGVRAKGKEQYATVDTPEGAWIADPFLYEADGEHYLFVELYEIAKEKACIAYYRFIEGKPVYQGKIIEQPYHMSYPCVFSYHGEHYMIPETSADQSMDLYKAGHFPDQWEKIACLSSGTRYVDTTVLKQDNDFKLVSYRKDGGNWYLDVFTLDMEKQKVVPLASKKYDTNIGRPAGSFIVGDDLVRPAQNCACKYGESIILYQVDRFEEGHFEEHEKTRIVVADLPMDTKADRIHTVNQDSTYECVDMYFEQIDLLHGLKMLWRGYLKKVCSAVINKLRRSFQMNEALVSIVVPIYKVEKYLRQCVDSIIVQTYANLEIILVDDGSPDRCPRICDEYAKADSRIKAIHKANGGLSDARNAGTMLATGEYIAYIDSDDWIREDYIEKLIEMVIDQHAEMAICGSQNVSTRETPTAIIQEYSRCSFTQKKALENLLYQHGMDTSAWGRIVKIEVAKKHLFPKGLLFEDLATIYKYMLECKKIAYTDEPLYFYYQNPTSITHTKGNPQKLDILPIVNQLVEDVTNVHPDLSAAALARKFSVYCYVMMQLKLLDASYGELEQQVWQFICAYRRKMILDGKARGKNRCAAILTYAGRRAFKKMK